MHTWANGVHPSVYGGGSWGEYCTGHSRTGVATIADGLDGVHPAEKRYKIPVKSFWGNAFSFGCIPFITKFANYTHKTFASHQLTEWTRTSYEETPLKEGPQSRNHANIFPFSRIHAINKKLGFSRKNAKIWRKTCLSHNHACL